MKRAIAVLVLLLAALAPRPAATHGMYLIPPTGAVGADGVITSDLDMDEYNIIDMKWAYWRAKITDAAPNAVVLASQPVNTAPVLTNTTGAHLVLAPSPGERVLEGVTLAASTGVTLTFDVYANGVVTQTVITEGGAGASAWDCDGAATDIICVCNLYTLMQGAGAITGVTVTRTDATCSDEKLSFSITPGVSEFLTVVTSDDTNVDTTDGTDGTTVISEGGAPTTIGGKLTLAATSLLQWNGQSIIKSSANHLLEMTNAAGQGIQLGFVSDTAVIWKDESGGAGLTHVSGGYNTEGDSSFTGDNLTLGSIGAGVGYVQTGAQSGTNASGALTARSGNQTNVGDYDSGTVTACLTGDTTTDGLTGDCLYTTGASGDGTGADAGDHVFKVNGADPALTIQGADADLVVPGYDVDYVISSGQASLGPTAPGFVLNDSASGLGFDVGGADIVGIKFEVPSCYDGVTDLGLKVYWFQTEGDALQLNETVIWKFDWRSILWGTETVDQGTAEADTVTWTETADPASDEATYEHSMTLVAGSGNQTIVAGDVLTGLFTRDSADTYTSDAVVSHWEIMVRQTSLKCDHVN